MSDQSDLFENELDEFFKERALFRTQTVADSAKKKVSSERCDKNKNLFEKLPDAKHTSPEDADGDFRTSSMSGCCMTGCHDCPWNYTLPS